MMLRITLPSSNSTKQFTPLCNDHPQMRYVPFADVSAMLGEPQLPQLKEGKRLFRSL